MWITKWELPIMTAFSLSPGTAGNDHPGLSFESFFHFNFRFSIQFSVLVSFFNPKFVLPKSPGE
jgi:hypothetical protein